MMQYCPQVHPSNDWMHDIFAPCILNTVLEVTSFTLIFAFGTFQLWNAKKPIPPANSYALPYAHLFVLQIVLIMLMPMVTCTDLLLEVTLFNGGAIYGYMLLSALTEVFIWTMLIVLVISDRRKARRMSMRRHSSAILAFTTWAFVAINISVISICATGDIFKADTPEKMVRLLLLSSKYTITLGVLVLTFKAPGIPRNLPGSFSPLNAEDGSNTDSDSKPKTTSILQRFKMMGPFIWPSKSPRLQLHIVLCFLMLIFGRVTNVYVPIYSKKIVDSMTIESNRTDPLTGSSLYTLGANGFQLVFRWDFIVIYVGLRIIQGGNFGGTGLIGIIRSMLWITVEQYTKREVQVHFVRHLLNHSLRFHLERKTGEVLRSMDRGTESIYMILNYLVFSIMPTIADIIIAIIYLSAFFGGWFGFIVFTTMLLYMVITIVITEWRTKYLRSMNEADNLQKQQSVDALLNFETVKYYTNEEYETNRYEQSIVKYQTEEWKVSASICVLNMTQLLIISAGLLAGSLLCVYMVIQKMGGMTVGDYVLFTQYLMQLYGPLNYFGTFYRLLQKCFIDMENMLELMKDKAEIIDEPDAVALKVSTGTIEFKGVTFCYLPEKEVLRNISFTVPGGTSVALVGASGGGKTSIVRLLFRFYDPTSGEILIDGQPIQKMTQKSLRQSIGVVPQDTVLFNDSIRQNILYGRIGSEEVEMENAAKAACIHDRVLTFQSGYETVVGERGLKLSGGEKQRVAIARTILKNPAVILLDEATSALDTRTERQIQASLQKLCEQRTSIIVAHRLSTIVNVDQILVLKDGEIAECGKHGELLLANGIYASLWNEQLKSTHSDELDNFGETDQMNTNLVNPESSA